MKSFILAMTLFSVSNAFAVPPCKPGSGFPCQNKYDEICTKPFHCICPAGIVAKPYDGTESSSFTNKKIINYKNFRAHQEVRKRLDSGSGKDLQVD